jgi:AAA family ATP:ADP antiporter
MRAVLRSGDDNQGISALEFLDNLFDIRLRRLLIPLAEARLISIDDIDKLFNTLHLKIVSEFECLKKLLARGDNRLTHASLYLIAQTNDLKYKALVESKLNDYHYKVQKHAKEIIKQFRVLELRD